MESWKIKELEEAVLKSHGISYADKIHEPLQSFHLKSMMAFYHAEEYQKNLNEMLKASGETGKANIDANATLMAIFQALSNEKKGDKVILAKFKAEANLIASAQAIHSLFDIIASIVYLALKLDSYPNPLLENKINLYSVNKFLKKNPICLKTLGAIKNIISSPEFDYLAAYVNTTKHRSLVSSSLSASFVENKSGILLKGFTYVDYKGNLKHYNKKWSQDFILVDFQKLRSVLFCLGDTLNSYLK